MNTNIVVDQFVENLEFEDLKKWASFLEIIVEEPMDDDYPDWISALQTEVIEKTLDFIEKYKLHGLMLVV